MGGSPVLLDPIIVPLIKGPEILDVGCGFGKWGVLSTTNYWQTHNPSVSIRPEVIGCDAHLSNVLLAKQNGCYSDVVHLVVPPLPFDDASFDTVLLIEIIEHLEEHKALELIKQAKRVARHRVIVSTPNFPDFRGPHETITGWNAYEAHVSYLSRRRLRELGFSLRGAGWKPGSRYWRGLLRRVGKLNWYDERVRPCLSSLSLVLTFAAENVVGVWDRDASNES